MTDPINILLQQEGLKANYHQANSRYYGVDTTTTMAADGTAIIHLRRRLIPPPEQYQLLQEHTVSQGERPDLIAQQYLGDSEQFWRICDANAVSAPDELTDTIGRKIRITLPVGISDI